MAKINLSINEVKVEKVTKFTQSTECAFCEGELDSDPYKVKLEGKEPFTLCDRCGGNFCDIFDIEYEDES